MITRKGLALLVSLLLLFVAGCPGGGDNPEGDDQAQAEMPREIDEMNNELLDIMWQADRIPLAGQSSQQEGEDGQGAEQEQEPTFDETTLGEVLDREMEDEAGDENQTLPEDTEAVWDDIKMKITELHSQWNELEPLLVKENVSEDLISAFEEELDSLTTFSTSKNQSGVLTAANQLTFYLSKFREPFTEDETPLAYELRYHVRSIVLNAAGGDFAEAQDSLAYIKEQQRSLTRNIEDEESAEMDNSLDNLERALDKENLDLVKINAAEVMENLVQITRD